MTDDLLSRITIDPAMRSGKPCIRGMRVTVADVLGWVAAGMSTDEILADYPYLEADDVRAAAAFAVTQMTDTVVIRA